MSEFNSNSPLLNDDVKNKLKSPDVHEKENEYTGKMVMPVVTFKVVLGALSLLCGTAFWLFYIKNFFHLKDKIPIYGYFIIPALFVLSLIFLHSVQIDVWVPHLANSRIGSSYCLLGLKSIRIDYDMVNSKKDIVKFVNEITDKSEEWNYFIQKISPTTMTIKLKVRPKVIIPTKADFDEEVQKNEQWNAVPLGICLTDESELGTINWMINDNNPIKGKFKKTEPSPHFLVAGGTGSGKSVLENNIIRHSNKFPDNFQTMLCDVKQVEFGQLSTVKSIAAIALTIEEVEQCLRSAREIMYARYKFLREAGVNNIYKLENYKCTYFSIENTATGVRKLYQFDEIMYAEVNGEIMISTLEEIYKKTESDTVKIYFSGQFGAALQIDRDPESVKKDPSHLLIRQISPGDCYSFNNKIYDGKEKVQTDSGEMTAAEIFNSCQSGSSYTIDGKKANKDSFSCIECIFKPKIILVVVDEMTEVMETQNFKLQSSISDSISSVARLGRAAACHLCLATQRPSGNVISSDLKNNIQMTTLLGLFGTSESTLCFDDDISDFCKPEIKGRGFVKSGNDIYEYQSFFIHDTKYEMKDKDFESTETLSPTNESSTSSSSEETSEKPSESRRSYPAGTDPKEEGISREEARKRRLEARKRRIAEKEAKKDAEFEAMIDKEANDPNYKESSRGEKEVWEAEDFFKDLDDTDDNSSVSISSSTSVRESSNDNEDEEEEEFKPRTKREPWDNEPDEEEEPPKKIDLDSETPFDSEPEPEPIPNTIKFDFGVPKPKESPNLIKIDVKPIKFSLDSLMDGDPDDED